MATVESWKRILDHYDDEQEVVLVLHPYRGSSQLFDIGEDAEVAILNGYDEASDQEITERICAIEVTDHHEDFERAEGERWPGRQ